MTEHPRSIVTGQQPNKTEFTIWETFTKIFANSSIQLRVGSSNWDSAQAIHFGQFTQVFLSDQTEFARITDRAVWGQLLHVYISHSLASPLKKWRGGGLETSGLLEDYAYDSAHYSEILAALSVAYLPSNIIKK